MKLIELTILGFRSFQQETVITFPLQAGLFHIRGENKKDPGLGGNAVGKSTLTEAICWCLYGKTSRGLSGPAVETWGSKKTKVQVVLELDGSKVWITRTRQPNNLYLGEEIVSQEVIDDLIAISYERFLQCVLLGQFGTMFPDMKPTARLDLISQVLQLSFWSGAAGRAKEKLAGFAREITDREKTLHGLESKLTVEKTHLEESATLAEKWSKDHAVKIAAKKEELEEAQLAESSLETQVSEGASGVAEAHLKLQKAQEEAGELTKRLSKEMRNDLQRETELKASKRTLDKARKALDDLDAQTSGKCPLCGQVVDTSGSAVLVSKAETVFEEARLEFESAENDHCRANQEYERMRTHVLEKERDEKAMKKIYTELDQVQRGLESKLDRAHRDADRCQRDVKSLRLEENPYTVGRESLQETIENLEAKILEEQAFLYDFVTSHALLKDWPQLFKELRLWVVEEALDELEIYVNSSLMELGLHGWSVSFQVERETKAGTVSRGFDILVTSPGSPEGVPWEAWSGGETQRLRVACAAGIAELIRSRTLVDPFFEIWDEPTAHLDEDGVKDLIAYFSSRADRRQIWLVDHRSLDSGAFDASLTVIKDEKGSRVTVRDLQVAT